MPKMSARANFEIEFDLLAIRFRVLNQARQIVVLRPLPDKRRQRSCDVQIKYFVVLKQRVGDFISVRRCRETQADERDKRECTVQQVHY